MTTRGVRACMGLKRQGGGVSQFFRGFLLQGAEKQVTFHNGNKGHACLLGG